MALTSRVHQQRVHGFLVALHHVENAVGQASLLQQVGDEQARAGIDRAGLEHEAVAGRDGQREHPHRHHHRKVERGDARDHAQRLAQRPVVDAGGDLVGEVALEQLRNAAGELDDVDAARDLALRVGEHLAVFERDHFRQRVLVVVQQLQELEHHPRAADRRGVGPGREGRLRGGHGRIHIGAAGQRHLARDGAGGRVEHRLRTGAAACVSLAVDEMGNICGAHDRSLR